MLLNSSWRGSDVSSLRSISGLIMMLTVMYCSCSSKIMVVFRNMSSRLEVVMYLLFVVAANGECGCYRVGGARGARTRWLTIPRSGVQDLSCFILDLARNGREAFCRSIAGCRCGVLYPCWQSNLSPSRSLTLYNLGEVSKSSSIFDVGLFGSIHRCCFYFLYHPIGLAYTLCGLTGLGLCPPSSFLSFFCFFW